MKKLSLTLFMLIITVSGFAQADSAKIKELIYNQVYKNISSYWLTRDTKRYSLSPGVLSSTDFFDYYLPSDTYKMMMDIYKLDWQYPVKGYTVFLIKMQGIEFYSERDSVMLHVGGSDGQYFEYPGSNYLIALKNNTKEIKFLGGALF